MSPDQKTRDIHPLFADPKADTILKSVEGTFFRVHSCVLTAASGWFRVMLSLSWYDDKEYANPDDAAYDHAIILALPASVLAALLTIITCQPLPALDSLDFIDSLLQAAEKYDVPTVVSVARLAIMSSKFIDARPVQVYGIACSRGWVEEARLASTKTITLNLRLSRGLAELTNIKAPHMARLLDLHQTRREKLREALDDACVFQPTDSDVPVECSSPSCGASALSESSWWRALERSAVGVESNVIPNELGLYEVLKKKCERCHRKYDAHETLSNLYGVCRGLPVAVEL